MAVVVTGSVSDFIPTARLELRTAVATQASVAVSAVTLDVMPLVNETSSGRRKLLSSRVELTFTITVASAAAAVTTVNALGARLVNATTASTFLTTSSYTATVLTIARAPVAAYPPPPPPAGLCLETCMVGNVPYASDGICDDDGPGAEFSACPHGTDCADCGVRALPPPPPPRAPGPKPIEGPFFRGLTPVSIGLIGVLGAVFACALGYACFRALFARDGVPTGSLERKPSGRGMGLSAPEGDGMILGVTAAGARTVASI